MSRLLYIHLPFCRSKCRYCDFYSETAANDLVCRYIDALAREWEMRISETCGSIATVYIGGGTPSLLTLEQWAAFHEKLLCKLPLEKDAEWTVECNPDSFTEKKAAFLARIGVNRVTLGIQSLCDRELRMLKRPHDAQMAQAALDAGVMNLFRSVGVDVMYGLPGQTLESFTATLQAFLGRSVVKHLSAYELSIADGTPFGRHRQILPLPDEDVVSAMTDMLFTTARRYGFEHYEISNFARAGYCCRHNIGYWEHNEYYGLGASAHSYIDNRRFWNVDAIMQYCLMVESGMLPIDKSEFVDRDMYAREMLFLGFRQTSGLNEELFRQKTGWKFDSWADPEKLKRFLDDGLLVHEYPLWRPTEKGLLNADYLSRELF